MPTDDDDDSGRYYHGSGSLFSDDPAAVAAAETAIADDHWTKLSGQQREMVESGAYLVAPADGDLGAPQGRSPDNLVGQRVVIDPISADGKTAAPCIELTLSGIDDPIVRQVMTAAGAAARDRNGSRDARVGSTLSAWTEVARRKNNAAPVPAYPGARAAATATATAPAPTRSTAAPEAPAPAAAAPPLQLVFDFGRLGKQVGIYVDAVIHDHLLVLVGDPRVGHVFIPPAGDDPLTVHGLPDLGPVPVVPTGVGYQYAGRLHCLLTIVRPDPDE